MKLTELEPRWITRDGNRVGLLFRCPHCVAAGKVAMPLGAPHHERNHVSWLTCFLEAMPSKEQYALWSQATGIPLDEDGEPMGCSTSFCNPVAAWRIVSGADFSDISISPSIDASASGHWHGYIRNGEVA